MTQHAPSVVPPHVQLVQMASAHWQSHIVYTAARLGLADHLAQGPRTAADLAAVTGTHPPSLARLLRTLASLGILTEQAEGFATTAVGRALQTGAPGAARAAVLTLASENWVQGFAQLPYAVRTGKSGYEKVFGMGIFEWLAQHPDEAALFSQTMVGFHGEEPAAVVAAYEFGGLHTIVDVGGATGLLLETVLERAPGARGILFDLPHVIAEAAPRLANQHITTDSGSFFERVPTGADAYLLSHVIHDWPEAECLTILGNCRRALQPGGRILLVEMVLPEGDVPHPGKLLDMMMLVGPGGQERTAAEYADLAAKAGLRVERIVPTASAVSVIDLRPV